MQRPHGRTTSDRTDAELIRQAQDGDIESFGALVERYRRSVIRIATVASGSAVDADDIAQEVFMKAHAALPRSNQVRPSLRWRYRIVTNTARNRTRLRGRQRHLAARTANLAAIPVTSPDEVAIGLDDRRRMLAAIGRLRSADRLVLTYRWYEQLSEAEIAESLGCRRGTVKSRLSRAMARLRDELAEPQPTELSHDRGTT
jgi:RNA polymerase sigma factor (sigma-70 family)